MKINKDVVLLVLRETAVCIVLIAVALGLNYLLFKDYVVDGVKVVRAETIEQIERGKYVVVNGNIQDMQNPTETYVTTPTELDNYQTEYRYSVGTINPFVATSDGNDLPGEMVDVSNDIVSSAMQNTTANSAANAQAESEAAIDKMRAEESGDTNL